MDKEVEDGLMLQDLVSAKLISDYTVIEIPDSINDLQGTTKVSWAVQWLVSHCPCSLDLCCQTLIQYVEDGIGREFSGRFFPRQKGAAAGWPDVAGARSHHRAVQQRAALPGLPGVL